MSNEPLSPLSGANENVQSAQTVRPLPVDDVKESMVSTISQDETAATQPAATQPAAVRPSLYRHPVHQLVGGVCGGIADALNIDPALVRALWVVLTLGSAGAGFLAYLALWLLLPVGTSQSGVQSPATLQLNERNIGRAGTLLISFGVLWLLANVGVLPWVWDVFWTVVGVIFWPALLIGAGMLLLKNHKEWRTSFGEWRTNLRSKMRTNAPAFSVDGQSVKSSMKSGMKSARTRIPLKRSRTDRLVLGVCGGLAQTFNIDANLVRLFWILFSVGSVGTGALIYALAGFILPERSVETLEYDADVQTVQIIDGSIR